MKKEVKEEEMKKDDKDLLSYRAYICIFFNVGGPLTHILEYWRWMSALRTNAVPNHANEMMLAIVGGEIEQNEKKMWRPWVKPDETDKIDISATESEYREMLGKLIRQEVQLPHEVAQKGNISLNKRRRRSCTLVSMKMPRDEIEFEVMNGTPVERQESTTLKCHRQYIKSLYDMTVRQAGDSEWPQY